MATHKEIAVNGSNTSDCAPISLLQVCKEGNIDLAWELEGQYDQTPLHQACNGGQECSPGRQPLWCHL